jgi:predicted adenine nucleotide alpha hydrolase (AANH) superfamily ATPase
MINYHQQFLAELETIGTTKPTLLLHVCCGPCSSNTIKELSKYFRITVFYSNSNIYPNTEYLRRYQELLDFIKCYQPDIKVIEQTYNPKQWLQQTKEFMNEPERGKRCYLCYQLRMQDAYTYASNHHFDYWTTVLSVSPHKSSQWINEIGATLSNEDTKFLHSDFKKDNGYYKSVQMAKEFNLYRQEYCGCVYSYQDMLKRKK